MHRPPQRLRKNSSAWRKKQLSPNSEREIHGTCQSLQDAGHLHVSTKDRQPTGGKVERASPRGAGHDCAAFLRLVGGPGAMLRSAGCARTSKRASKPSCEAGEADNSNVRRR